jgi:hypothetical protein
MLQAICDLTQARPHMRTSARYSPEQRTTYHEGYYTGVIMALRVAELAIERYELASKTLRAVARAKRSA